MKPRTLLAVCLWLLAAGVTQAGPRWYDIYADAQKIANEYGRIMVVVFATDKEQLKCVQIAFDKPELARFHPLTVYTYDTVKVQNGVLQSALLSKFVGGERLVLPVIVFAGPDEKLLYKLYGLQTTKTLATAMGLAIEKVGRIPSLAKLKEAKRLIARVAALVEKKDFPAAGRVAAQLGDTKLTPKLTEELQKSLTPLNEEAGKLLADALQARDAKNYAVSVPKLAALKTDFPSLEAGKKAIAELEALRKLPEAKAAFDALGKAPPTAPGRVAQPPSAVAAKTEDIPEAAIVRPKPEEDPAAFTDEELDALDELSQPGGPEERAAPPPTETPADEKAQRLFRFAQNWITNQQPEKARKLLQQILDLYPSTATAEKAKALLESLP